MVTRIVGGGAYVLVSPSVGGVASVFVSPSENCLFYISKHFYYKYIFVV